MRGSYRLHAIDTKQPKCVNIALEVMSHSGTRGPYTLDASSGANTTRPKILLISITFIFAYLGLKPQICPVLLENFDSLPAYMDSISRYSRTVG